MRLFMEALGLFSILAAAGDWDWFFRSPRVKFFVDALGHTGARVFYAALGLAILVIGHGIPTS